MEDLGEARPSEADPPRGFGLILDLPVSDRPPDLVGEGERDGNAGGPVLRACRPQRIKPLLSCVPDSVKLAIYYSLARRPHGTASWGTLSGRAEGSSLGSRMITLTRLAGSSTSTDSTTARTSRPWFSGVRTSQIASKSARHRTTHEVSISAAFAWVSSAANSR